MTKIFIINGFLIMLCVFIHFEVFRQLSKSLQHFNVRPQFRVLIAVYVALSAHFIEVWLFGIAYYVIIHFENLGSFEGNFDGSLIDSVYFSLTSYTSLGYGDIEPIGMLRFTAGVEALSGLVLITWSASFLFLEMQRSWQVEANNKN